MDSNALAYDIVLLPNLLLRDIAISQSQKLAKDEDGAYFVLSEDTCVPHLSLYMVQLKVSDLPKVEDWMRKLAATITPLQLEACRTSQVRGYLDVEYRGSDLLNAVQMQVVNALNPIREGMPAKEIERMNAAEGLKRQNFQKYGYPNVGDLFRPHLTFTRLKNEEADFNLEDISKFSGVFNKLGVFEVGDHGTCTKEIRPFELLL
jgi:hypothetical protein